MGKEIIEVDQGKNKFFEAAMAKVKDRCACCVIITCSEPSSDGKMEVEMSFDGEEALAAFLVENAMQAFDERITRQESQ